MLLLSHNWLYNIEVSHNPTVLGQLKWARPISSLKCLSVYVNDTSFGLTFDAEISGADDYHQGSKKVTDADKLQLYTFKTVDERKSMVDKLKQLFFFTARKPLFMKDETKGGKGDTETKEVDAAGAAVQPVIKHGPVMSGRLVKLTTVWGGKHYRLVKLYDDGFIEWMENELATKVYREIIMGPLAASDKAVTDMSKKLTADQKDAVVALKTTGKPLVLLADNKEEKERWYKKITEVLAALDKVKKQKDEAKSKERDAAIARVKEKQAGSKPSSVISASGMLPPVSPPQGKA